MSNFALKRASMHDTLKFSQNNDDLDVRVVSVADPGGLGELNPPKFIKLLFHSFSISIIFENNIASF